MINEFNQYDIDSLNIAISNINISLVISINMMYIYCKLKPPGSDDFSCRIPQRFDGYYHPYPDGTLDVEVLLEITMVKTPASVEVTRPGKRLHKTDVKSPFFLMGKSTISTGPFSCNSHYQRLLPPTSVWLYPGSGAAPLRTTECWAKMVRIWRSDFSRSHGEARGCYNPMTSCSSSNGAVRHRIIEGSSSLGGLRRAPRWRPKRQYQFGFSSVRWGSTPPASCVASHGSPPLAGSMFRRDLPKNQHEIWPTSWSTWRSKWISLTLRIYFERCTDVHLLAIPYLCLLLAHAGTQSCESNGWTALSQSWEAGKVCRNSCGLHPHEIYEITTFVG